ncbi:hypothetical protein GGX14DRAFT_577560 [Mycena pura]|uniref:Uncharacterized protein n=1 Tax=Mycena pura TaxID=153505 RepID=A0AAD6URP8_9AGAR|nr:hypothetical protein GGX14DRAFT_577560 [Mycena pura]
MAFTLFNAITMSLSGQGNLVGTTGDVFETVNAAVEDATELVNHDGGSGSSGSCVIA